MRIALALASRSRATLSFFAAVCLPCCCAVARPAILLFSLPFCWPSRSGLDDVRSFVSAVCPVSLCAGAGTLLEVAHPAAHLVSSVCLRVRFLHRCSLLLCQSCVIHPDRCRCMPIADCLAIGAGVPLLVPPATACSHFCRSPRLLATRPAFCRLLNQSNPSP